MGRTPPVPEGEPSMIKSVLIAVPVDPETKELVRVLAYRYRASSAEILRRGLALLIKWDRRRQKEGRQ